METEWDGTPWKGTEWCGMETAMEMEMEMEMESRELGTALESETCFKVTRLHRTW